MLQEYNIQNNLNFQMMYDRMRMNGQVGRFLSYLTGSERQRTLPHAKISNQVDHGIETICIGQIRGSVNKTHDFDVNFNPLSNHTEKRWIGIASAMSRGEAIPPIEVIKVDDIYYVVDGHHRVSAARALEFHYLEARVIELKLAC